MTPRKLKILLILAIVSIVLFGGLFWMMTATENTQKPIIEAPETNNEELLVVEDLLTGQQKTQTPTAPTTLAILIPSRFYNDGFAQLAKNIKEKHNLTINYKAINDIQYYHKIIQGIEKIEDIDLYLMPSDRLIEHQKKEILLREDINPFMHTLFNDIDSSHFIPYAIDPLVVLSPNSNKIDDDTILTWKDIASYIINEGQANKIKTPLLRGLDKNDEKILINGSESFPNYFIITYNIIKQIYQNKNINDYQIITDTINNIQLNKRSYANFKISYNKLKEKNKYCETFPDICIISYNYGDIKFGFLSDISIQQKIFANETGKVTELNIYNFPLSTGDYPVRGRGFSANSESTNDDAIQIFINEYLYAGTQNSLSLRDDVLSAFNNIFNIQSIEKKYSPILQFENNFSLISSPIDHQKNFINNTNFIPIIKEKRTQEEFFMPSNRIR